MDPIGSPSQRRVSARRCWQAAVSAAVMLCLFPGVAAAATEGGRVALGLNLGIDISTANSNLGPGGVWHLVIDVPICRALSLAFEIGTAANETDSGRIILVDGIPREVNVHAVSTVGLLGRYALRAGSVRPYVAAGLDYYSAWDDVAATGSRPAVTFTTKSGVGLHGGAGSAFRISSHWDLLAEGIYYLAPGSHEEASFLAFRGGVRFFLGRRELSSSQ